MSTIPSNTPENTNNAEAILASGISAWWTDSVQEKTVSNTAQVLDFSSRLLARRAAETPAPIIKKLPVVNSSDELSELVTKELPDLLEDVFSKAENINDIHPETMSNFQTMMHMAAEIDAKAGRFGMSWVGIFPPFSDIFKKALKPPLKKLISENEQLFQEVSGSVSIIFNSAIQEKLLTRYGDILKNKDTYESSEKLEERLEALKWLKRDWRAWALDWALVNEERNPILKGSRAFMVTEWTIPKRLENILVFVLETFVEHYVEKVWETESALRHGPAEVAKSA